MTRKSTVRTRYVLNRKKTGKYHYPCIQGQIEEDGEERYHSKAPNNRVIQNGRLSGLIVMCVFSVFFQKAYVNRLIN